MAKNDDFLKSPHKPVWRIGHRQDPLAFVPHQYTIWRGRFDDPQRKYRTLYCTESQSTALLEVLGSLAPDIETTQAQKMIAPFKSVRTISLDWLRERVVAPARIQISSGQLVHLADPRVRREIEKDLANTLVKFGIRHLDLYSAVHNSISPTIGRMLYEQGAAALAYPSPHDSRPYFALFEGRAWLEPAGKAKSMEEMLSARPDILDMLELSIGSTKGESEQRSQIYQLSHIDLHLYHQLQNQPELIKTLNWRTFEKLLADIIETFGYTIDLTQPTKDGGIDIIAFGKPEPWGEHRYIVQAKQWRGRVGIEPIRELMFLHNDQRATRACLATTSTFTKGAWELSDKYRWQLDLKDYNGIKEWIERAISLKNKK